MFTKSALESGYVLTTILDENNIVLNPRAGTPLEALVNSTTIDLGNTVFENGHHIFNTNLIVELTQNADPLTGYSESTQLFTELAEAIAPKLSAHLAYARTTGAGAIESLAASVQEAIDAIGSNPDSNSNITIYRAPGPLVDPHLLSAVDRSANTVMGDIQLGMNLPQLTDEDIYALMQTGSPALDASVVQHFANLNPEWMQSMWRNIYTREGAPEATLDSFIRGRSNISGALFVFLTSRRLFEKMPEGVDMPLALFEDKIAQFRNQSAQRITIELAAMASDDSNDILIREVAGTTIVVNENIYRKWLRAGGKAEALLGNMLDKSRSVTSKALLDNQEVLVQLWNTHYAMNRQIYENMRFNRIKTILRTEYNYHTGAASEQEFPVADRAVAYILFDREVQSLTPDCTKDLLVLCTRLLGRSRFYKTDVERILMGKARAQANSPKATPAEAAAVAAIEYIAEWTASMMQAIGGRAAYGV